MTPKPSKPNPVPSMLIPAVLFCGLFFLGMGYFLWNVKVESDRKRLEAFGVENFKSTQMEQWKRCNSIDTSLEKVYEQIPLSDDSIIQSVRRLVLPNSCFFLYDLAARTYAERVRSGK